MAQSTQIEALRSRFGEEQLQSLFFQVMEERSANQRAQESVPPLVQACACGDVEMVQRLLDQGQVVNLVYDQISGGTCLHIAALNGLPGVPHGAPRAGSCSTVIRACRRLCVFGQPPQNARKYGSCASYAEARNISWIAASSTREGKNQSELKAANTLPIKPCKTITNSNIALQNPGNVLNCKIGNISVQNNHVQTLLTARKLCRPQEAS